METIEKVLVIHPKDVTTNFLKVIYKDNPDWKVIDYFIEKEALKEEISNHDRIIMMGHGTPGGLLGFYGYMIDWTFVEILKEKRTVCIWCNADKFVERHELDGFYTGMVISEVSEANMYSIYCTQQQVDDSNERFANTIKNSINTDNMLVEAKKNYQSETCEITQFNETRMYFK